MNPNQSAMVIGELGLFSLLPHGGSEERRIFVGEALQVRHPRPEIVDRQLEEVVVHLQRRRGRVLRGSREGKWWSFKLADWFIGCLYLVCFMADCLFFFVFFCWLADFECWLSDWFVGWLILSVGWLIGLLVGWSLPSLESCLISQSVHQFCVVSR